MYNQWPLMKHYIPSCIAREGKTKAFQKYFFISPQYIVHYVEVPRQCVWSCKPKCLGERYIEFWVKYEDEYHFPLSLGMNNSLFMLEIEPNVQASFKLKGRHNSLKFK